MSKLIYSPTSTLMEDTYLNIKESDQTTNGAYFSIGITGDGYMYTHGKKFRLFLVINDTLSGLTFSVSGGVAQFLIDGAVIGLGDVIQSVTDDTIINSTTTNGVVALSHKLYLNLNSATLYGSASKIPIVTVDKYGHITDISLSPDLDLTKVIADTTTAIGTYYLTGVTDNTAQNPIYSTNSYIDKDGNIYGRNFYLNGNALSTIFAPIEHVEVEATSSAIGHVKLYDLADNDKGVSSAYAATPKAVYLALASAKTYADDLVAAQDSMVFVGTIDSTGTIKAHNANVLTAIDNITNINSVAYKVGWTFRFTDSGTFLGQEVEPGDMLIAVRHKGNNFAISDWTIIQNNISGALTSTNVLSGILYANNSRSILSLAFLSGVLTSNGSGISFVNANTLWRTIKVKDVSIGTNELNLKEGSHINIINNNGEVSIGVNTADIIGTSSSLTITKDLVEFEYNPSNPANLAIGNGLTLAEDNGNYTLSHATLSVTVSNKLGKITTDSYGHITNFTEVLSLKNPTSLIIRDDTTEHIIYDGSVAKTLKIIDGTDIDLTLASGVDNDIVLTPSITHKYRPVSFYATSDTLSPTVLIANNASTTFTLVGGDNVTLTTTDGNGNPLDAGILKINAEDTWRAILAYKFAGGEFSRSSIGSGSLKFSNDFIFANDEIGLCWTEIDNNGRVTYVN